MKFFILVPVFLTSCVLSDKPEPIPTGPTEPIKALEDCPEMHASSAIETGDVITSSLRALTIDNGIVRLRYGGHAFDFRDQGVTSENTSEHVWHVMAARHTDDVTVASGMGCQSSACHSNGTHWHDTTNPWYGDAAKLFIAPAADADRVRVLEASDYAIELAYEWDAHALDGLSGMSTCIIGTYPNCGPVMRSQDSVGAYFINSSTYKSVPTVKMWKTVRIERCAQGYFSSLRTDPPMIFSNQGTRSYRLGYGVTAASWKCDGSGTTIRNPVTPTAHQTIGTTDCIAAIPAQVSGHDGWPFLTFMKVPSEIEFQSLQYYTNGYGAAGSSDIWDKMGLDGRFKPWQLFIGAVEYVSSDVTMEPTMTALGLAEDAADLVVWPQR